MTSRLSVKRARRWAWMLIGQDGAPFAASLAVSILLLLATRANVQMLAEVISALDPAHPNRGLALLYAILFGASSALVIGFTIASRMLTIRSDTIMVARLQQMLHDKLLALEPDSRTHFDPGAASALVLQAPATIQPLLRDIIVMPLLSLVAFFSAAGLLVLNFRNIRQGPPLLIAVVVLVLPLLPLGMMIFARRLRAAYETQSRSSGELARELANSVADIGQIAIFDAQAQRSRRFAARLRAAAAGRLAAAKPLEAMQQFQANLPILVQAGLLLYATLALREAGATSLGAILAIYYFAPDAVRPTQTFLSPYPQISANWETIALVGNLLDTPESASPACPAARDPAHAADAAELALNDVSFSFGRPPVPLLHDLSHIFPAGSATAVVGRCGSGKSTLLSLAAGVRLPTAGTVLVDGMPPRECRRAARGAVSLVSQVPLIIADTVRENFRLACDEAEDADIEAVCREVGLWPILRTLSPDAPLDAVLSPSEGLSAGARHLLAVARALLVKPHVLLLDEPTTGVDALAQDALLACLQRVARKMTVIIVEHNVDFIWRLVGTVCCLEEGCFTAIGTASELAERPCLFRSILRSRAVLLATDRMSVESVPLPTLDAPAARERATA